MKEGCKKQSFFLSHGAKVFGGAFLIGYTLSKIDHYSKQESEDEDDNEKHFIDEAQKFETKKKTKSDLMGAPFPLNPFNYNINDGEPISSFELPMRKSKQMYDEQKSKDANPMDKANKAQEQRKIKREIEKEDKLKKETRAHYDYDSIYSIDNVDTVK
ncbi:uncharacterized protein LOC117171292 [Belonocnema kinseyi]|uniref:uncharacterized protein LOC117171292 n=1 Tax=Belonocnema kinseyi TaxID=2817044 RepID=UPI00143DC1CD|nr:uncharacterized protein LOC117171292 [Belonocnema kinseyi]